jgi:hypothetical protein
VERFAEDLVMPEPAVEKCPHSEVDGWLTCNKQGRYVRVDRCAACSEELKPIVTWR